MDAESGAHAPHTRYARWWGNSSQHQQARETRQHTLTSPVNARTVDIRVRELVGRRPVNEQSLYTTALAMSMWTACDSGQLTGTQHEDVDEALATR